jgi:adenylate cyclase
MDRRAATRLRSGLLAGAAVAAAASLLHSLGALEPIELRAYDVRMRWTIPDREKHREIALVIVSDECIESVKASRGLSWPWDRRVFAQLIASLGHEDWPAKAVLLDFFTHVDPGPGEAEFAEAIRKAPPVTLAVPFKVDPLPSAEARPDLPALLERYAIVVDADDSVNAGEEYASVVLPVSKIAASPAGVADVSTPRSSDGIIREYRLFSRFRGRFYPSLALAALMTREGARTVKVRNGVVTVGRVSFPVTAEGRVLLRYYERGLTFPWQYARRLLLDGFDATSVADRLVIVGTTAAALYDLRVTPVTRHGEMMPGAEIHAVALANLLGGDGLRWAPGGVAYLAIAVLALATALVTRYTPAAAGGAIAAALFVGAGAANTALFRAGWVIDLVAPLGAVVLAYASTSMVNFLFEGRERRRVKGEFQRRVAPRVVEKILEDPEAVRQGRRKELTLFFMDFEGFTSLSETLEPAELVALMNEYHNEAAEEILRAEGTIDKYIGDAIMAFWNDPADQPDHAARACAAALVVQARLHGLAARMKARGLSELRARIGINTGIVTVGDMGAREQANYTAIGDEVNLASRLEGANKEFGTEILVSESTRRAAGEGVEVRELALLRVKGKRQAVRVYELLGLRGWAPPERLEAARRFEAALADFRARRWEAARASFDALGDRASALYGGWCDRLSSEAPPPDWDGAIALESK